MSVKMKEKNDTLVTQELVESIVQNAMEEIFKLKQEQGQTISKIEVEKKYGLPPCSEL